MSVFVINKGSDKVPLKTIERVRVGTSPTSGSEYVGIIIELVKPYAKEKDELVAAIVGA